MSIVPCSCLRYPISYNILHFYDEMRRILNLKHNTLIILLKYLYIYNKNHIYIYIYIYIYLICIPICMHIILLYIILIILFYSLFLNTIF